MLSINNLSRVSIIYGVSGKNRRDIGSQELVQNPNINAIETMCYYCFKKGCDKKNISMFKTWKDNTPFKINKP